MSLISALFRRRETQVPFDPDPGYSEEMPARPYRVLHAGLPFFSDAECRNRVAGATLLVLRCEDPAQAQQTIECMPSRKNYSQDDIVQWEINNKELWSAAWYIEPGTGAKTKAWAQAVAFVGKRVRVPQTKSRGR
jgi:hypothetical protein